MFPVEYWQLDKLITRTGKVALIVKNINDPYKVTAKWVSFDPENPPLLATTSRCFVLTSLYYKEKIGELNLGVGNEHYELRGLRTLAAKGAGSSMLVAILGQTTEGEYVLYIQNASANLIDVDPKEFEFVFDTSPGGEAAVGAKLPRKPK